MNHKIKLKGTLKTYLRWPVLLSVLLIAASAHIYLVNRKAGMFLFVYLLVYLLIVLSPWMSGHKKLQQDLIQFAQSYGRLQMKMMQEMSLPFAVLSVEGHLLWGNDEFLQIIVNKKAARRNIANVFPEITLEELPKEGEQDSVVRITHENKCYRSVMRFVQGDALADEEHQAPMDQLIDDPGIVVMFLYDETEMVELEEIIEAEKLIVGLLYIDNFEETLASIDEVRQSLLSALIDRKINKYMQEIDAISKKLEKDKYLFIFKQEHLDVLKASRFSILEEVRAINIGNEQTCTISIGIGVDADTYTEQYNNARAAIDLALGRGGDQAVIKSSDSEEFYGGKRVTAERNTRVKARVKAHALKELIEGKEKVMVMGHSIGDPDSFGASVGIYRIAKTLGRKAYVVLNECSRSVKPLCDRFYNSDYEDDMIISKREAVDLMDENTLLVIVDVNKADYTECPELIDLAQSVVVIDHHRQAGDAIGKAVLFYIEPYASSASEMVSEISQYIGNGLKLKPAEAEALYAGIMIDTNYFVDKTGVRTFEAMAYLRRNGVDAIRLRKAFRENMDEYKIKAAAIQDTTLYLESYAITESKAAGVDSPTVLAAKIANELLDIDGVKASFVLTDYNNKIYISARSIDEVNVQVMMEHLGGGGHINMAGAQLTGCTVKEAEEQLRRMLDDMIGSGEIKQ
jgi:c-di-AMP phosphodiesterase-like protein